jgi:hypothetical protein
VRAGKIFTDDTVTEDWVVLSGNVPQVNPVWWGMTTAAAAATNTTAIHQAKNSMTAGMTLYVPPGEFDVTNVVFDPASGTGGKGFGLVMDGTFFSDTAGICLTVGTASNTEHNYWIRGIRLRTITALPGSWALGGVGLRLVNLMTADIGIKDIAGFAVGVKVDGQDAGVSHCTTRIGRLYYNETNLLLTGNAAGYVNANYFYGGNFMLGGAGVANIQVDHIAGEPIRGNHFYGCSLQAGGTSKAAILSGRDNVLHTNWVEGDGTGKDFDLSANSYYWDILISGTHATGTITDLGTGNRWRRNNNSRHYEATQYWHPEDYGAKGDGVTDDELSIRLAILAAEAVGGGTVFLGPKVYLVGKSAVWASDNVVVKGSGIYSTRIHYSSATDVPIQLYGANNFAIRDLTVSAWAGDDTRTGGYGISIQNSSSNVFD